VTPNRELVRRFLSNYFDLLLKVGMIKWHKNVCFDMLLFDKFVHILLVVDFIAFAANMLLNYTIDK